LRNEGDFYQVVESHADKPLRLFVYNIDFDVTREVVIVPNRLWSNSGDSLLGCGVGYGLLHRIPKPQDNRSPNPTTTSSSNERPSMEEEDYEQTSGVSVIPSGMPSTIPGASAKGSISGNLRAPKRHYKNSTSTDWRDHLSSQPPLTPLTSSIAEFENQQPFVPFDSSFGHGVGHGGSGGSGGRSGSGERHVPPPISTGGRASMPDIIAEDDEEGE